MRKKHGRQALLSLEQVRELEVISFETSDKGPAASLVSVADASFPRRPGLFNPATLSTPEGRAKVDLR